MIETLLVLNGLLLIALYLLIAAKVGRIVGLVYFSYMGAFTVLKPALLYYYDLYYPYSTNDDAPVQKLLLCSLIFLAIQFVGIRLLADRAASRLTLSAFDFERVTDKGILGAFLILMLISFVGSTIKFGTPFYLFSFSDTFEAAMNLADGSWYINYLAEILFTGLIATVACLYWRYNTLKSVLVTIGLLAITYLWIKAASRTGALVVLISWMACYFTRTEQRRINTVYIAITGYVMLILLYVGNLVRVGNVSNINLNTALFGAVFSAASDLSPVDNAALLYSEMAKHDYTYFLYLIGAAMPTVLIPSSIFPFKVPADKDAELTRIFFPQGADTAFYHEGSTLTFTVPASGYADAGYLGVIVASIIYAALFCWYIKIYRQGSKSARFIAIFQIIAHIVGYRLSIETMLIVFYTALLLFGFTRQVAYLVGGKRAPVAINHFLQSRASG